MSVRELTSFLEPLLLGFRVTSIQGPNVSFAGSLFALFDGAGDAVGAGVGFVCFWFSITVVFGGLFSFMFSFITG